MKVGTKSVLFGVHQAVWHPITVYLAWKRLYGKPGIKEIVCIIMHDWGYWKKPNMDGEEGRRHPELAARIAKRYLGDEYSNLCLYHSRNYSKGVGAEPSRLCWADKKSIMYEPAWFYLLRARLSGELKEYRQLASEKGHVSLTASDREWFNWLREFNKNLEQQDGETGQLCAKGHNADVRNREESEHIMFFKAYEKEAGKVM